MNYGKILGSRILVEEEEPLDSITARAAKANITIVLDEKNRPRPTTGKIVARGKDPLLDELELVVGCRVNFGALAGQNYYIDGKKFRSLEAHEILGILPELGTALPISPE